MRSLGRQMRSEADLRRLMRNRVEPEESGEAKVDAVVLRLKGYGYLNDAALAKPMPACAMKTRSWASAAFARTCSRRA